MWNPIDDMGTGNRGDSIIAHITPKEAVMLALRGGSGTVNPKTGFLQFFDVSGAEHDAETGFSGGDFGGGLDGSEIGIEGLNTNDYSNDLKDILGNMEATSQFNQGLGSDIEGEAPMGVLESKMQALGIGIHNLKADPLGTITAALTPSYQTLGTVLGFLSPVPFGSLLGGYSGKQIDKYGLTKTSVNEMQSSSLTENDFPGSIVATPAAQTTTPATATPAVSAASAAPAATTTANTSLIDSLLSAANKRSTMGTLSDRGTGGGGLGRLLRG